MITKAPSPAGQSSANPLWGGGYEVAPDQLMTRINASISVDKRLYREDIHASIVHATMLKDCGIISAADHTAMIDGLNTIMEEIESGQFTYSDALEDIHMHVESRLAELIGDTAGRLHTARSRNDQVATDFRLWVRGALENMQLALKGLQAALIERAETHAATIMPGFTHLQSAQPVTFGHHLMAYVEMFGRDRLRLRDAITHMNECPLGAAALAGTSFPIDRAATAKALAFDRPCANSLDAVGARDFALELLSAAAIASVHMSRLAEELILWTSSAFHFIALSDAFSTGSSIMPQKRNPDAAELVRGKTGRAIGNLVSLLATMKALPMTYNKDLQEDKEPVFDTVDNFMLSVSALTGMIRDMTVNKEAMHEAAGSGYANATDLADWLVQHLNMPFRQAHHTTAKIVRLATTLGKPLEALTLAEMQSVEPELTDQVYSVLGVKASVESRKIFGGTAPERVRDAIKTAKDRWLCD